MTEEEKRLRSEVERLQAIVDEYDSAITWHTTCLSCSKLIDVNYSQYCELLVLRKVAKEAMFLRSSGYDGPMMGEEIRGLFTALDELERYQPTAQKKPPTCPK